MLVLPPSGLFPKACMRVATGYAIEELSIYLGYLPPKAPKKPAIINQPPHLESRIPKNSTKAMIRRETKPNHHITASPSSYSYHNPTRVSAYAA